MDLKTEIFKKISEKDRVKILSTFFKYEKNILYKFENSHVYKTQLTEFVDDIFFVCKKTQTLNDLFVGKTATVNFNIQGEVFFFKSPVILKNDKLWLDVSSELFLLQRRKNKRVAIPEDVVNQFKILSINGRKTLLEGKMLDLSLKGGRVEISQQIPQLKSGQNLTIQVRIGNRRSIELDCVVRHQKNVQKANVGHQIFGVEFIKLEDLKNERIKNIYEDICRSHFQKY